MNGYFPGASGRRCTSPRLFPVITFSTFREVESNSSAEASSFVMESTVGVLALTVIVEGENLWSFRVTAIGPSANAGDTRTAARAASTRIFMTLNSGEIQTSLSIAQLQIILNYGRMRQKRAQRDAITPCSCKLFWPKGAYKPPTWRDNLSPRA